jgi:hypothetical protein
VNLTVHDLPADTVEQLEGVCVAESAGWRWWSVHVPILQLRTPLWLKILKSCHSGQNHELRTTSMLYKPHYAIQRAIHHLARRLCQKLVQILSLGGIKKAITIHGFFTSGKERELVTHGQRSALPT